MKFIYLIFTVLFSVHAFAGVTTISTGNDAGIVIKGDAAKVIYDKMSVEEEHSKITYTFSYKLGKNVQCTKTTDSARPLIYSCFIKLVEANSTDGQRFTGEVGDLTE